MGIPQELSTKPLNASDQNTVKNISIFGKKYYFFSAPVILLIRFL